VLIIRKEQIETLDRAALRAFEDHMVQHLQKFAPRLFEFLGEPSFREVIRLGVKRAGTYGLTTRGPVRLYIELMVMFGSDFDTDPLLRWAAAVLSEPMIVDPIDRADQLYRRAITYQKQVIGARDAYWVQALRNLHQARLEDYPIAASNSEEVNLNGLSTIYPQKCASVVEPALRALIRRGPELANRHAAATDLGIVVFILLPFMLGHGFATDPMYPWIARILNDPAISDPTRRAERLFRRSQTYLGEALNYLEREE
jgi:hypothetical protein